VFYFNRTAMTIFNETKKIDNIKKFFSDLDRINTIRKYFEKRHSGIMESQNREIVVTDSKETDEGNLLKKLHHEFILVAANIETQLLNIFNSQHEADNPYRP